MRAMLSRHALQQTQSLRHQPLLTKELPRKRIQTLKVSGNDGFQFLWVGCGAQNKMILCKLETVTVCYLFLFVIYYLANIVVTLFSHAITVFICAIVPAHTR